jgi:heme/copper-type cytochrome/quinol oxidase subunit 3
MNDSPPRPTSTPPADALTREERIALANRRFGLFIFQMSWILVFVLLVIVNLQIRANFESWPPPGVPPLDAVLPTIATAGLIVSGLLAGRGLARLRADDRAGFVQLWTITLALGVAFVLLMLYEWAVVPFSEQFSTIFRVMTAFHIVHGLAVGVYMLLMLRGVMRDAEAYRGAADWAVEGGVRLWYFVVIAWLLFYVTLYIL